MKKILITGKGSYIGSSFDQWLKQWPKSYIVDSVDTRDNEWKKADFTEYDVVFHVAGLVHEKETKENAELYYFVNRDLTYEIGKTAKNSGVKQFIFLSSMSVYGKDKGIITSNTKPEPKNNYAKSKLQAEQLLEELIEETFKVAILRPPMVYGKGCKGNYVKLASFALKLPFFPYVKNKRSMLFIDNLSECIKQIIDNEKEGLFFPQNSEYVCTSEMVKSIGEAHGKNIWLIRGFSFLLMKIKLNIFNKVFGTLIYDKKLSNSSDYNVASIKESIFKTELMS